MLFDYAANTCGVPGKDFVKLFIASSVSKRMENGEPICLVGKSGIEIARGKKTKFQAKSQKQIDILPEILYTLSKIRNTNFKGDDFL